MGLKVSLIGSPTDIKGLISRSSLVPLTECIDIIPRRFTCEGDLVRGKTNDLTVLLMEFAFAPDELSSEETVHERQSGGCPQLGTWKSGQWVEIEVVDGLCNGVLPPIVNFGVASANTLAIEQLTIGTASRAMIIRTPILSYRTPTKSLGKAIHPTLIGWALQVSRTHVTDFP